MLSTEDLELYGRKAEAVLFLEAKFVSEKRLANILEIDLSELGQVISRLNQGFEEKGEIYHIEKLEDTLRLTISPRFDDPILDRYNNKKKRLPKAMLETLSIIAYKQPITRAEIDEIRGSSSGSYIRILTAEQFIRIAGKKNAPGKPVLYRTTHKFLCHFNLQSLNDLPSFSDIKSYEFLSMGEGFDEGDDEEQEAIDDLNQEHLIQPDPEESLEKEEDSSATEQEKKS